MSKLQVVVNNGGLNLPAQRAEVVVGIFDPDTGGFGVVTFGIPFQQPTNQPDDPKAYRNFDVDIVKANFFPSQPSDRLSDAFKFDGPPHPLAGGPLSIWIGSQLRFTHPSAWYAEIAYIMHRYFYDAQRWDNRSLPRYVRLSL